MAGRGGFSKGMVKAVLSGDLLVVITDPVAIPVPEKELRLAGIMAPRLAWKEQKDEPFAWESREALRSAVVGQLVLFRPDVQKGSANQTGGREFAHVFLGQENLSERMVKLGMARVKSLRREDPVTPEHQALVQLEDAARAAHAGVWTTNEEARLAAIRDIPTTPVDLPALVAELKGKKTEAFVEQVRDGSAFRILLLPSFRTIFFFLSGIACPPVKRDSESGKLVAAEFGFEAKRFTEMRVCNRRLDILVEGADKFQNVFGQILHPRGDIREELLKNGLAKVVRWSLALTADADRLVAAEAAAREARLALWKDYVPTPDEALAASRKGTEFTGKIVELNSGDAFTLLVQRSGELQRATLSSIRTPRMGIKGKDRGQAYSFEARELVRKLIAGRTVTARVDYARSAPPGAASAEDRLHCTLIVEGPKQTNVALALVAEGLATVVRHRQDEERSPIYETLRRAEEAAAKAGQGVHSTRDPPVHHVHDLSSDKAVAQRFRPFFERERQLEGVVEFVATGSRLKVYVPHHSCLVMVVLAGISCPRRGPPPEPFYLDAVRHAQEFCLFREVKVMVEGIDSRGGVIGTVLRDGENLALRLLSEGLATIHDPSISRAANRSELRAAEERAIAQKLNLFKNADRVAAAAAAHDVRQVERTAHCVSEVVVCDVVSATEFYMRSAGTDMTVLEEQLKGLDLSSAPSPDMTSFRRREYCAARYETDSTWYRARIDEVERDGHGEVVAFFLTYIDYGNCESVPCSRVRRLPFELSPPQLPPQATECSLAFIKGPQLQEEFGREAASTFQSLALNERLASLEVGRDALGRPSMLLCPLSVGSPESITVPSSFSATLLARGLAVLDGRLAVAYPSEFEKLQPLQDLARQQRFGALVGSLAEQDDDEFGMRSAPRRR